MATNKKKHKPLRPGGAPKQNLMLAKIEAKKKAEFDYERRAQMRILEQIYFDAFCLACNEVFQMGPGRAKKAMEAYRKYVDRIAQMIVDDEGDKELTYAFEDVDRALRKIVGEENFKPHDERYGWGGAIRNAKG
jgi:hypothetical protein